MRVAFVASSPACPAALAWAAVCLFAVFSAVVTAASNVLVQPSALTPVAIGAGIMAVLSVLRSRIEREGVIRLVAFLECFNLLAALGIAGAVASYSATFFSGQFVDPALSGFDKAVGFDWLALYKFVDANPWAQSLGRAAYVSFFLSPLVLIAFFSAAGRVEDARMLVLVYAMALMLTVALYPLAPAMGPFSFYGVPADSYVPICDDRHVKLIEQIKAATVYRFEPDRIAGLISFPSFHGASGIVFIWSAWRVRLLRWPFLVINAAMICATPIEGNHYLFDIFGGAAVAVLAIWGGTVLVKWSAEWQSMTDFPAIPAQA